MSQRRIVRLILTDCLVTDWLTIFVFRAWYGPDRDRADRHGRPNQAFVGFTDFVYRLMTEQAPRHDSAHLFQIDHTLLSHLYHQVLKEAEPEEETSRRRESAAETEQRV